MSPPDLSIVLSRWDHWTRDENSSFTVKDDGRPPQWGTVELTVHLNGTIELDWPEGASPFLEGPDEARWWGTRLSEAALLSELILQGWMVR